jgi:hypothetical protein
MELKESADVKRCGHQTDTKADTKADTKGVKKGMRGYVQIILD